MESSKDFSSRKEWEKFLWNELIQYLHKSKSPDELERKLTGLFSKHEKDLAIRRLTALVLMHDGLSYRRIGEILWISSATINMISKSSKKSGSYLGRKNKPNRSQSLSTGEYWAEKLEKSQASSRLEDFLNSILEGYTNPKKRWEFYNKYK